LPPSLWFFVSFFLFLQDCGNFLSSFPFGVLSSCSYIHTSYVFFFIYTCVVFLTEMPPFSLFTSMRLLSILSFFFPFPALGSFSRVTKVRILHAFLFTLYSLGRLSAKSSSTSVLRNLYFPLFLLFSPSSSQIELCSLQLVLRFAVSFRLSIFLLVRPMTACTTRSVSCLSVFIGSSPSIIPCAPFDLLMSYASDAALSWYSCPLS
jgi:hypothetical protein